MATCPKAAVSWHAKKTERKAGKEWNKKFNFSFIAGKLKVVDACSSKRAKELQQQVIDFGSHPNFDGLYSNLVINTQERGIGMNYLHNRDLVLTMREIRLRGWVGVA